MSAAMFQLSVGRQVKRLIDLQPGDIQSCLDQALHEISPFADDKSITITVDSSRAFDSCFSSPASWNRF